MSVCRAAVLMLLMLALAGCVSSALEPTPAPAIVPRGTFVLPSLPSATPQPRATVSPAAPVLQLAAVALDTVVRLSWPPVPGGRGYYVFRDAGTVALNPTPLSVTSFEDSGLTNGRTYRYNVTVVDANGQALMRSADISVTPAMR